MNSHMRWLFASVVGSVVFFGEFGCLLDSAEQHTAEASQRQTDEGLIIPAIDPLKNFVPLDAGAADIDQALPTKFPALPVKEMNTILISGCEREPDEIPVPINVADHNKCHKISAEAYYAGSKGIVAIKADFTWKIDDATIVKISSESHSPLISTVVLEASTSIFSESDLTAEPRTTLTVCATPKHGWQNANTKPLCRSLPVFAVANMEGSWCFTGKEFIPDPGVDCEALTIKQDGRFLSIANRGDGTIYEKQINIFIDNLGYRTNENTGIEISGIILAGEDVEGTFSAFRLPL
jgi:hypothetical protein